MRTLFLSLFLVSAVTMAQSPLPGQYILPQRQANRTNANRYLWFPGADSCLVNVGTRYAPNMQGVPFSHWAMPGQVATMLHDSIGGLRAVMDTDEALSAFKFFGPVEVVPAESGSDPRFLAVRLRRTNAEPSTTAIAVKAIVVEYASI